MAQYIPCPSTSHSAAAMQPQAPYTWRRHAAPMVLMQKRLSVHSMHSACTVRCTGSDAASAASGPNNLHPHTNRMVVIPIQWLVQWSRIQSGCVELLQGPAPDWVNWGTAVDSIQSRVGDEQHIKQSFVMRVTRHLSARLAPMHRMSSGSIKV